MAENEHLMLLWENRDPFVPGRGSRLAPEGDALSAEGIARYLKNDRLRVEYVPVIGSTNTAVKERAHRGEPEGLVLAAGEQTGGRGRMGRRFFSPAGSGIYMSLLLRPGRSAAESALLTPAAAVAAAESIEAVSGLPAEIKWVNDVLVAGRKVCGILTEASVDGSSGAAEHVVIGIGVNALPPPGGFPGELRDTAGAVFPDSRPADLRCRLAAAILDRLMELYAEPDSAACHEAYKSRSAVLGKEVRLLSPGRDPVPALVLDIDRDYALRVRLADGTEKRILSGEVSLRTT